MPSPFVLELTDAQRATLVQARDHHPKPYLREQAAALAPAYDARGRRQQPRAWRRWSANTETRVVATLATHDGRAVFRRGRVSIDALVAFYQQLRAAYPDAERIYVVQDN